MVNQIITAGTAAQTIIVRIINQTAVIFSTIMRHIQAKYLKIIFLYVYYNIQNYHPVRVLKNIYQGSWVNVIIELLFSTIARF